MTKKYKEPKFMVGQKVIVNTGGADTIAIIDYTRFPLRTHEGETRIYVMDDLGGGKAWLCRFTEDFKHTIVGGGEWKSYDAEKFVARSSQFIPEKYIRPFVDVFKDM